MLPLSSFKYGSLSQNTAVGRRQVDLPCPGEEWADDARLMILPHLVLHGLINLEKRISQCLEVSLCPKLLGKNFAPAIPRDEDDVFPLTRALSKRQKRKEPEPSGPSTRVPLFPLRKPLPLLEPSSSWSTSTEESSEGEDNSDDAAESIQQQIPVTIPDQLTEETVLPSHKEEAEALPVSTDAPSLQINANAELARQIAHEEFFEEMPNCEEIIRNELRRMYEWQRWRMSKLEVIARTCSLMWEEEQWSLDWMGTRLVFVATRPDEIDRVYNEKLADRFDSKGKGRGIDAEITYPKEQDRADKTMIEKAKVISRIQSSFKDMRPGVGMSHASEVPEDSEQEEDEEDQDDESSGDQSTRPTTDAPNKEAPDDLSDSFSSNNSGKDHNNNRGVSNHPQDEEELKMIAAEDTHPEDHHDPMEEDDQNDHILSSPRENDESRNDNVVYALPLAVIVPRISLSST
nr:glutamic acid-rich protein-like [Ipomoea batatas]